MFKENLSSVQQARGFVLLPVILILAVIAAIALLGTQESIIGSKRVSEQMDLDQATYTSQSAISLATRELRLDTDCSNYSISPTGIIDGHHFTSSITPDNGSPITLTVDVDLGDGKTRSVSSEIKMYTYFTNEVFLDVQQDTYIQSTDPFDKNGSEKRLHIKKGVVPAIHERLSFLQFDVSNESQDIDNIVSAAIELHTAGSPEINTIPISAFNLLSDWLEDEANYLFRKKNTIWGYSHNPDNEDAQTIVNENITGWKSWDITELTKKWISAELANYGVVLKVANTTNNNLEFYSGNADDASLRPRLHIISNNICECGFTCN